MIKQVAEVHGCTAEIGWRHDKVPAYGPTVNDPAIVSLVERAARKLARWERLPASSMAGEDFGFMASKYCHCILTSSSVDSVAVFD